MNSMLSCTKPMRLRGQTNRYPFAKKIRKMSSTQSIRSCAKMSPDECPVFNVLLYMLNAYTIMADKTDISCSC